MFGSNGSKATEMGCPPDVRFPPDSDQSADITDGPFRAKKEVTAVNRDHPKPTRYLSPIHRRRDQFD